ncbi:MAG: type II toxin-antitoxin system RelE/ParE family toxin [Lachnospiraceae bacterium]|nr:type II toxin-antitoxin system RelE/ParE family toxin [Lachnospiraceae bacterium]
MTSDKYQWQLTEIAENDIDEATAYIAQELQNPDAASHLLDEIENALDRLSRAPFTGRIVNNNYIKRNDVRRILVMNYIVYYLVDDSSNNIIVLRFAYNRRNQSDILETI